MKNRFLNRSFMLLALMGVLFTSCKKDHYDEPPIQDLPIGQVYTIDQILALESGFVFNEDASVYGTITADEVSGNLYKAAFMQDPETGKAIELYLNATSGVRIGDRVRIYLKGVTYALYNGLPQLSNFEPDGHIIIMANNQPIEPLEASISEICSGSIAPGSLVKLSNVMFTEKNTFADPTTYGNRTLVDPVDYSKTVIVRTSNYANFANDSLPQGTGNMIAIASLYNSTWQLLIRSARELDFSGYHPTGELPYYQDFASSFGTYTTFNVLGEQSWTIDYNTAKMTGYENSTNYANEDWLISSRFSLENVSSASLTMSYIARYFNDLNNDITIQVSSDYTSDDPNLATWTVVPASWTSGSDWSTFASTTVDLSQFVGQKVSVAVKYLSTDVKAGTIEVQSILIQEGSGPTPPPGPTPGGEVQAMPYTQNFNDEFGSYMTFDIAGSQQWMIDYHTAKMTGYESSVNYANEDWLISSPVAITGVSDAKFTMTYIARYFNNLDSDITLWASSNYVYGNNPTTASWTQVPASWTACSDWNNFKTTEVSLTEYVGQTVTFAVKYVSTDVKAGTIEIQSITISEGSGVTPPTPPTPPTPGGSGTAEDPYNVGSGITLQGQDVVAWVQGYIVGAVKSGISTVTSNADINWAAPFDLATNVVIADDPACQEISSCVIVNLPAGKPLRSLVNLMDNPNNLGLLLAVNGKLRTYFGQAGLRDSGGTMSDFILEGFDGGDTGGGELQTLPYSQLFERSFGTYTTYSVAGAQTWVIDYSTAKMTGYEGSSHANEDWLISSPMVVTNANVKMLVTYVAQYQSGMDDDVTIQVSSDYHFGDNPTTATWTELSAEFPNTADWNDFQTVTAGLEDFVGQQITVAVKYLSTDEQSRTLEVKSITVE